MRVLILRPQPGAGESAARARALGLDPVVAPLFVVRPLPWQPPDARACDAILLTSANAARHGGGGMTSFLELPCFAIGEGTAAAARAAGFVDVRTGPADGAAALGAARAAGARAVLHLGGVDHIALPDVTFVAVYAAEPTGELPSDAETMLALLHSPRAAQRFAALANDRRERFRVAAISAQTARAAGRGWRSLDVAAAPRDAALLALAAKLCQKPRQ